VAQTVIRALDVSKKYILGNNGHSEGLRHLVQNFATAPFRWLKGPATGQNREALNARNGEHKGREVPEPFWALKNISFEIKQGEVVGVIGRNGAGKSTLLKILSRITEQTEGRVEITGRIASLLEVGTGFHPELSGRENIFLNGAILGMGRAEIKKKFDEIVAFAEVERFLDTPVKRYSSGMYVRLAFAVAAHLEPEILIVDEVLAVGDAEFQKKCLGKMQDVARGGGRTVLFVSHNIAAVLSLCTRGIFLKSGRIAFIGDTQDATHAYMSDGAQQGFQIAFEETDTAAGDDVVRVHHARILGPGGAPQGTIRVSDEAWVEVDYEVLRPEISPRLNLHFCTEEGAYAFASIENTNCPRTKGRFTSRMHLPANFLNGKSYMISIYMSSFRPNHVHVELRDVLVLSVVDDMDSITRQTYNGPFPGALRPVLHWEVEAA
jgi:lipopolysaccharide transport system ATP-binding protein